MVTAAPNSMQWHTLFTSLMSAMGTIIQTHFPNSSPLDEHPASIWIFIICSLFYCFAFGYHIKCHIYNPDDATSLKRSVKVAFIFGGLAYAALISLLVPRPLQPLVFLVCLILLFTYFNRKNIAKMGEKTASYLCDLWTRAKSRASSLLEQWRRTESGKV